MTTEDANELWKNAEMSAVAALEAHRLHRRRGDVRSPYINHVAEVAMLVTAATRGRDPVLTAAAWLHDLPPKCDWTHQDLNEHFGEVVATLVMEVQMDRTEDREVRRTKEIEKSSQMSRRGSDVKTGGQDQQCARHDQGATTLLGN